jgi:hypothetical protein
MPLRLPSGTSLGGPIKSNTQSALLRQEVTSLSFRSNYRLWFEEFTDFAQSTLALPWVARTATTAGSPTFAQGTNSIDGFYTATLAANNEAETAGVDWGDVLMLTQPSAGRTNVNAIFKPALEAFVRIPTALAANQTAVIGLTTAFNATLASISKYVWFRVGPGNMNVTMESKDGTTTNLLQAPADGTFTMVANTYYMFSIDWTLTDTVRMWVDDHLLGYLNMGALAATDKFQPSVLLQKSSGTGVPTLDIDWACASAWRPAY